MHPIAPDTSAQNWAPNPKAMNDEAAESQVGAELRFLCTLAWQLDWLPSLLSGLEPCRATDWRHDPRTKYYLLQETGVMGTNSPLPAALFLCPRGPVRL